MMYDVTAVKSRQSVHNVHEVGRRRFFHPSQKKAALISGEKKMLSDKLTVSLRS